MPIAEVLEMRWQLRLSFTSQLVVFPPLRGGFLQGYYPYPELLWVLYNPTHTRDVCELCTAFIPERGTLYLRSVRRVHTEPHPGYLLRVLPYKELVQVL